MPLLAELIPVEDMCLIHDAPRAAAELLWQYIDDNSRNRGAWCLKTRQGGGVQSGVYGTMAGPWWYQTAPRVVSGVQDSPGRLRARGCHTKVI